MSRKANQYIVVIYLFLYIYEYVLSHLSHVQLFVTLWTIAHQASLPKHFCRQEYWSRLPYPPPGDLSNPGIGPASLCLLPWQAGSLLLAPAEQIYIQATKWEKRFANDMIYMRLRYALLSSLLEILLMHLINVGMLCFHFYLFQDSLCPFLFLLWFIGCSEECYLISVLSCVFQFSSCNWVLVSYSCDQKRHMVWFQSSWIC